MRTLKQEFLEERRVDSLVPLDLNLAKIRKHFRHSLNDEILVRELYEEKDLKRGVYPMKTDVMGRPSVEGGREEC